MYYLEMCAPICRSAVPVWLGYNSVITFVTLSITCIF